MLRTKLGNALPNIISCFYFLMLIVKLNLRCDRSLILAAVGQVSRAQQDEDAVEIIVTKGKWKGQRVNATRKLVSGFPEGTEVFAQFFKIYIYFSLLLFLHWCC